MKGVDSSVESRLELYYSQSVSIYGQESNLLFQRFNFFLVAMSFLVAATIALLTSRHAPHWLAYALTTAGCVLSAFFALVNFMNAKFLKEMRDYIFDLEHKLQCLPGPGGKVPPPYTTAWPALNPLAPKGQMSIPSRLLRGYPAFHTWCVPLLLFGFWVVAAFYSTNLCFAVVLGVSVTLFFAISFCLVCHHDPSQLQPHQPNTKCWLKWRKRSRVH